MTDDVRVTWEGKRPTRTEFDPLPALRCVEEIGAPEAGGSNRLIQGDNLAVMAALSAEMAGKIDLLYLDPPFFTGREWRTRDADDVRLEEPRKRRRHCELARRPHH